MTSARSRKPALTKSQVFPDAASDRPKSFHILHVINTLGLGGAETLLYRLIARDPLNEHVVVSLGKPGWYSSRLQEKGVLVHHLNMHSLPAVVRGMAKLNRIVRRSEADIVQCWMYRSNIVGGLIAKAAGRRVVWGIHHATISTMRLRSRALVRLGGIIARWTPDYIINCSVRSVEIHKSLGYSAARGSVVNNGYDPQVFFPDESAKARARSKLGIEPGRFVIGTISRWHPEKDIPNLVSALQIARQRGVPLLCLLIGVGLGEQNRHLAALIRDRDCEDFIVPLGVRRDIQDLARALDLHVLASTSEAFPSVVAETMLSGAPNAVTDVGDAARMIGDSGWVIPPRDPHALAAAIIEAFREFRDHPRRWKARRDRARERIAANYSIGLMSDRYSAVWQEVTEQA